MAAPAPIAARPVAPPGPDAGAADPAAGALEVVVPKPPGYLGFAFRVRRTGQLFRVGPARYPGQPRFYAIWIHRCVAKGVIDGSTAPRLGSGCLRWEELGPAVAAIRDDLEGWLAREEHRAVRDWVLGDAEDDRGEP
jgi:hypothetical protein